MPDIAEVTAPTTDVSAGQDQTALPPDFLKPDPKAEGERASALEELKKSQSAEERAVAERNVGMADLRKLLIGSMGPTPARPVLEPYREPPNVRAKDGEAFAGYYFPLLIMSALLGRVARTDMVDGLNMLSMGMRGFQEGRTQYAKHMTDQWSAQMEKVSKENERRLNDYNAIINDRKLSMQEQELRMKLVAQQYDDSVMLAHLKSGNRQAYLTELGKANLQQDKFMRLQMQYYVHAQQEAYHRELIQQRREDRQARVDHWGDQFDAASDKEAAKQQEKIVTVYNTEVEKWLTAARNGVQGILRDPYKNVNPQWADRAFTMLANDMASEMAFYNARIRSRGYPVPPENELLEDANQVKQLLLSGKKPAAMAPPTAAVAPPTLPPPVAPAPGTAAPATPAAGAEGSVTEDQ